MITTHFQTLSANTGRFALAVEHGRNGSYATSRLRCFVPGSLAIALVMVTPHASSVDNPAYAKLQVSAVEGGCCSHLGDGHTALEADGHSKATIDLILGGNWQGTPSVQWEVLQPTRGCTILGGFPPSPDCYGCVQSAQLTAGSQIGTVTVRATVTGQTNGPSSGPLTLAPTTNIDLCISGVRPPGGIIPIGDCGGDLVVPYPGPTLSKGISPPTKCTSTLGRGLAQAESVEFRL